MMLDDDEDKRPAHSIEPAQHDKRKREEHEVDAPSMQRVDDETNEKKTIRQE